MTNYYMQEIDRLKVELEGKTQMYEELYDHHFKEHHTPDYERIEELQQQLAEAHRAGWEQCQREAAEVARSHNGCKSNMSEYIVRNIVNMKYKEKVNDTV